MLHLLMTHLTNFAVSCPNDGGFFGFPHWYKYLPGNCDLKLSPDQLWNALPLIGLAIIDILLRVGALVAVGAVIYGGFQYMSSQGLPEDTKSAQNTIINALVGLVITIIAVGIVAFIGARLGG